MLVPQSLTPAYRLKGQPAGFSSLKIAGVKFSGLTDELQRKSSNLAREVAARKQRELDAERLEYLAKPQIKLEDQTLNGYQLLQLVNDLIWGQRLGLGKNMKRLGVIGVGTFWVGTVGIGFLLTILGGMVADKGPDELFGPMVNAFQNGPTSDGITQLLGRDSGTGLRELRRLGLLKNNDTDSYNPEGNWSLTADGARLLKAWKKGNIQAPVRTAATESKTPSNSSAQANASGMRLGTISALLAEEIPGTGWTLLKGLQAAEARRGLWNRMRGNGISESAIRPAGITVEAFRAELQKLQDVGLVLADGGEPDPEKRPWHLTDKARQLLSSPDALSALQVTLTETTQILEQAIGQIETEKGNREEAMNKVAQQLASVQKTLPGIQTKLRDAEEKVIALDEARKKPGLAEVEKQRIGRELSSAVFQVGIQEEQVKFHQSSITDAEKHLDAYKSEFSKWFGRAIDKAARLNRLLSQVNQQLEQETLRRTLTTASSQDVQPLADSAMVQTVFDTMALSLEAELSEAPMSQEAGEVIAAVDLEDQVARIRNRRESLQVENSGLPAMMTEPSERQKGNASQ